MGIRRASSVTYVVTVVVVVTQRGAVTVVVSGERHRFGRVVRTPLHVNGSVRVGPVGPRP